MYKIFTGFEYSRWYCISFKFLLAMKLTIALLLTLVIQVNGKSYAQKINLSAKHATVEEIFHSIKKQAQYNFFYDADMLQEMKPVTIQVKNASIEQVLKQCFDEQAFTYVIHNKTIIVKRKPSLPFAISKAAPQPISGKVTDESGHPLPGVSVRVKGQTKSTLTNAKGVYNLQVESDESLIFSSIGFETQEVRVSDRTAIDVILVATITNMDEVVVVGYGTQRKSEVTSAVSQVSQKEIRQTPGASLQNLLIGKLTGYFSRQRSGQPGSDQADFNIRGIATYNSGTAPLILVDNVEYNLGQFKLINVDEIESVSVLKDAEATAIYGVKGANGVVLVTTRRGSLGKPTVNFRTETGLQLPIRTFQTLNAYDAAVLTNEGLINDGLPALFTEEDLNLYKDGTDPYGHPDVDWYKTIFKGSAPMSDNNLNFSGGTEKTKYFLSLGYMRQGGLLRDIEYKGKEKEPNTSEVNNNYYVRRYKFRSNLDITPVKTLTISFDLTGTYHEVNAPTPSVFGNLFKYDYVRPYGYPVYNPDGSFGFASPSLFQPANNYQNPAALTALGGYNRTFNNFMNAGLTVNQKLDALTKGLSIKGAATYSYANTASRSQSRAGIPSYYYNPANGSYTPRDNTVFRIAPYSLGYGGGAPNHRLNLQAHLNYRRTFAEDHHVNALVLFNQTSYYDGAALPFNFRGYTYRFGYNYKERYIFSASGAYNGSDRFITQKRFNLFPAFALAYNLHNESFFKNVSFINQFKLRGSYGIVGNDNIGINQYFFEDKYERSGTNYAFGESPNGRTGIKESDLGNDDVSWESERKWNFGLDMAFFKNKLTITADYFNNFRYDILTQRQTIPKFFGVQTDILPYINLGKVRNKGFEIEATYQGKAGQLDYNVKGTLSHAKNTIVFRDDPPALYPWQDRTGMSIGVQKQYIWDGTFYTEDEVADASVPKPAGTVRAGYLKYQDLNGDGIINVDDMAYIDRSNLPTTVIGLTLGVAYKGFSISALFQAGLGADAYAGYEAAVPFKAALQPLHMNRWTPETAATATFPALTSNFVGTYMNPNGNLSTFWTQSTDYLRLRSMEIAYTFKTTALERWKISSLRLFANGYDLFTWSGFYNKYQYDPEISNNNNDFIYPVTKIVNVGVAIGF